MPRSGPVVEAPGMFMAESLYGPWAARQPTPTAVPEHTPGEPEPFARTEQRPSAAVGPFLANPIIMLVILMGVAVALLNISVSGNVGVAVSG